MERLETKGTDMNHDEIRDYLNTFEWFRDPHKQGYLATAVDRFARTLSHVPRLPQPERVKVLEIGGVPYFMTVLLRKYFGYEVEVANEPTWERGEAENHEVLVNDHGERHDIHYKAMNVEYDDWPYEDGRFDIVVYCEVIEHLVYDPTHTLVEAHRVLKDGGTMILSTPNALAYTYLMQMLKGINFYPPYSGYSHYARHHRLFSTDELRYLVHQIGFDVHECYSAYDTAYSHPPKLDRLVRALVRRGKLKDRLDVIYLIATATGDRRYSYPSWPYVMYTDVHAYARAKDLITMDSELMNAATGLYPPEDWGAPVRWTGVEASVPLPADGKSEVAVTFYTGPREGRVRGWVEIEDCEASRRDFDLPPAEWHTLTIPLQGDSAPTVVVRIGVESPLLPQEHDQSSRDDRELGVALREIAFL